MHSFLFIDQRSENPFDSACLQWFYFSSSQGREDFINTARAIAANAQIVAKFAVIIADHCLDET